MKKKIYKLRGILIFGGLAIALWPLFSGRAQAFGFIGNFLGGLIGSLALALGGGIIDPAKLAQNKLLNALQDRVKGQMEEVIDLQKQFQKRLENISQVRAQEYRFEKQQKQQSFTIPELPTTSGMLSELQQQTPELFGSIPNGEAACHELPNTSLVLEHIQRQIVEQGITLDMLSRLEKQAQSETDLRLLTLADATRYTQALTLLRMQRLLEARFRALQLLCRNYQLEQENMIKNRLLRP